MKRTGLVLLMLVFTISTGIAQNSGENSDKKDDKPVIEFDKTTHNYGKIKYNGDGSCVFEFENKGKQPLLLTKVRASCGCTTPSWPKEPIKSGKKGKITVKYNTRITGNFSKSILVYSNAKNSPIRLRIKGQVLSANKE
jgi:hypothetical protein